MHPQVWLLGDCTDPMPGNVSILSLQAFCQPPAVRRRLARAAVPDLSHPLLLGVVVCCVMLCDMNSAEQSPPHPTPQAQNSTCQHVSSVRVCRHHLWVDECPPAEHRNCLTLHYVDHLRARGPLGVARLQLIRGLSLKHGAACWGGGHMALAVVCWRVVGDVGL